MTTSEMIRDKHSPRSSEEPEPGGWPAVVHPDSAGLLRTRGLVKDPRHDRGHPSAVSVIGDGDGTHSSVQSPLKKKRKETGDRQDRARPSFCAFPEKERMLGIVSAATPLYPCDDGWMLAS